MTRGEIVAAARGWIGTPYQHQASVKGAGCDCLGLVRGVWRELIGPEPEQVPAYGALWRLAGEGETLATGAARHMIAIEAAQAAEGDVLIFRMYEHAEARHMAILSGPQHMIHAYSGMHVVESALSPWWRRRVAFAFAFPGVR